MFGFPLFMLLMIGIGFLAIYRGREAIRTKRMSNSAKSALVTGITELTGDSAVRMGKVSLWLGYGLVGIGGIGLIGSLIVALVIGVQIMLGMGTSSPRDADGRGKTFQDGEFENGFQARHDHENPRFVPNKSGDIEAGSNPFDSADSPFKKSVEPKRSLKLPTTSETGFPFLTYNWKRARNSKWVGFKLAKNPFEETSVDSGLLVGLAIRESDELNFEIKSVQAIYQYNDQYKVGEVFGFGKYNTILLAKPGYVVSGLNVDSGVSVSSIQCKFAKFDTSTGTISSDDTYESETAGKDSTRAENIQAFEECAVGIFGKLDRDGVAGIGLKLVSTELANSVSRSRTWTSSNQMHTFQATFDKREGNNITLKGDDGKVTIVPTSKLSESDNRWLKHYAPQ